MSVVVVPSSDTVVLVASVPAWATVATGVSSSARVICAGVTVNLVLPRSSPSASMVSSPVLLVSFAGVSVNRSWPDAALAAMAMSNVAGLAVKPTLAVLSASATLTCTVWGVPNRVAPCTVAVTLICAAAASSATTPRSTLSTMPVGSASSSATFTDASPAVDSTLYAGRSLTVAVTVPLGSSPVSPTVGTENCFDVSPAVMVTVRLPSPAAATKSDTESSDTVTVTSKSSVSASSMLTVKVAAVPSVTSAPAAMETTGRSESTSNTPDRANIGRSSVRGDPWQAPLPDEKSLRSEVGPSGVLSSSLDTFKYPTRTLDAPITFKFSAYTLVAQPTGARRPPESTLAVLARPWLLLPVQ